MKKTFVCVFRRGVQCEYELDKDVELTNVIDDCGPIIYQAQWLRRRRDNEGAIVLIERDEQPSEYEQKVYSTFIKHQHIIHTYGFVENDRGSVIILQEQAPYGNLLSLLQSGQFQPTAAVLVEIFSQVIKALVEIIHQGLVHGDLRCENIYVFQMHPTDPKKNSVKLANFISTHPNDASYTDDRRVHIPVRYCALEILRSAGHSNYSELSDVYSMGVLMWQAFSQGKLPYESSTTNSEVRQRKLKDEKLSRPLSCHQLVWPIIVDCWYNAPEVRFNFKDMQTRFRNLGRQ